MSRKTRKLIWSAPLVAVFAVIGALAIFAAQPADPAQAHDPPGAPTDLKAEAKDSMTIELSWTAPTTGGAPDSYRIDYLPMGSGEIWKSLVEDTGSDATSYTDDTLPKGNERRTYRVFAMNSSGISPVSDVAGATSGNSTPGAIRNFMTPTVVGPTQLNLSWDAPEDTGSSPITSYRIHMATGTGEVPAATADVESLNARTDNETAVLDTDSDATSFSVKGLRAGQTWRFIVYARNAAGNGKASVLRTQTTGDAVKPSKVNGLMAVVDGDNTIHLYWEAPESDGGSDITMIRVVARTGNANWPDSTETVGTSAGDLNTGLNAADDGNAIVEVAPAAGHVNFTHGSIDDSHDGDKLYYQVFLRNAEGLSPSSGIVSATVDANTNVPGAPGAPAAPPDAAPTPTTITLEWTAPTDRPGTGYRIDISTDQINWRLLERNTNFSDLPYEVDEGLKPSTGYYFRVFNNPGGPIGVASGSAVITTGDPAAPTAPRNLTATVIDGGQVDLSWDAPSSDNGSEITTYRIYVARGTATIDNADAVSASDFDLWAVANVNGVLVIDAKSADTSYSVTGLRAQQTLKFAVTAWNNGGTGGAAAGSVLSNEVTKTTSAMMGTAPMPMGLIAESARDSNALSGNKKGVLLLWNEPEVPAGGAVSEYEIQRKMNDGEFLIHKTLTGTDLSTIYHDPLEPKADETRAYRVRLVVKALPADTEKLTGGWVEVGYDLMGTPDHSHTMVPGKPTASARADSDTQITVSWTDPADNGGADIMSYIIERRYMGDMMGDIPSDGYSGMDGANRSFAFSNAMEWWETLNCKGMLAAAGSDEDPMGSGPDKMMYCGHFLNKEPSNVTDSAHELSADAKAAVEALFAKRYVIIDSATTMMYEDKGLMAETEYTYRVSAVNSVGRSMWSDPAMATTDAAPLTPPENVMASHVGLEVTVTWEGGMNADTFYVVLIRRDAEGDWDVSNAVADADQDGSPFTVNMSNRPAGTYHVLVIAGSADDGWSNWVSGTLDYAP